MEEPHMTKLPLYVSAVALAGLAAAWSVQASAAGPTPFYTPVNPSSPVTTHPYDIKPTAKTPSATPFYTPDAPTAIGADASSSSVAQAPHLRTDPMDPNHEPINP
jgi:hypothetical protein